MKQKPTLHELVVLYDTENKKATDSDNLSGNPHRWGSVRAMKAVMKVMEEYYEQ